MTILDDWTALAAQMLAVEAPDRDAQALILDVAREVAHGVARPAAPLGAFLLGLAVGRGVPLSEAAATMIDLARQHSADAGTTGEPS